jgi:hypothetical protein
MPTTKPDKPDVAGLMELIEDYGTEGGLVTRDAIHRAIRRALRAVEVRMRERAAGWLKNALEAYRTSDAQYYVDGILDLPPETEEP